MSHQSEDYWNSSKTAVNSKYEDILQLPHPVSKSHPRMSQQDRAAQFSPFAALTGYEGAIQETARLTFDRVELDESERMHINDQLFYIKQHQTDLPELKITYFMEDASKEGGAYVTVVGKVAKIDEYQHTLRLEDQTVIAMEDILEIEEME